MAQTFLQFTELDLAEPTRRLRNADRPVRGLERLRDDPADLPGGGIAMDAAPQGLPFQFLAGSFQLQTLR